MTHGDLVLLDLLTCDMATTALTLPLFVPWIASHLEPGRSPRGVNFRQQAEIYGRGYNLSHSHRHILN